MRLERYLIVPIRHFRHWCTTAGRSEPVPASVLCYSSCSVSHGLLLRLFPVLAVMSEQKIHIYTSYRTCDYEKSCVLRRSTYLRVPEPYAFKVWVSGLSRTAKHLTGVSYETPCDPMQSASTRGLEMTPPVRPYGYSSRWPIVFLLVKIN